MKKVALVLSLIVLIPFFFVGCGQENEMALSNYFLSLEYQESNHTIEGIEMVEYVNSSDNMLNYLCFHLYPNAFREGQENSVVTVASRNKAYPNGLSYGDISVNKVSSEGDDLLYEICGDALNILKITLNKELYPDETVKININFVVKLANINHRLGYGNSAINLGNFYPVACVYEKGIGFMTSPYTSNGDPFYSEVANYNVSISYSEKFLLASSGQVLSEKCQDGLKKTQIEGKKIRDFCIVLSDKFKTISAKCGNVNINYFYYNDPSPQQSIDIASTAVETFNNLFGVYPYSVLNIVETNFLNGGMEYPNLVMISDNLKSSADYGYVIAHELAHQWWYGVVGNDEYNHAWMDEGLTEYSTLLFYKENSDLGVKFEDLVSSANKSYKLFVDVYTRINGKVDTSMDRSLAKFDTEPEYVQCTYTKGVLMFNSLRETVGDKKFYKALKDYYKRFSYKNASPAAMIASFSSSTGYNLESFFNSWLNGEVKVL